MMPTVITFARGDIARRFARDCRDAGFNAAIIGRRGSRRVAVALNEDKIKDGVTRHERLFITRAAARAGVVYFSAAGGSLGLEVTSLRMRDWYKDAVTRVVVDGKAATWPTSDVIVVEGPEQRIRNPIAPAAGAPAPMARMMVPVVKVSAPEDDDSVGFVSVYARPLRRALRNMGGAIAFFGLPQAVVDFLTGEEADCGVDPNMIDHDEERVAVITYLWTRAGKRHRGAGGQTLDAMLDALRNEGVDRVYLHAAAVEDARDALSQRALEAFYKDHGFSAPYTIVGCSAIMERAL